MTTMAVAAGKPCALDALVVLLRALKLPACTRYAEEVATKATREGWTFGRYLQHLAELEVEERRIRRIDRALHDSDLPGEKTLATLDRARLPPKVTNLLASLCDGSFVERGENLLVFGLPGRGKSHVVAAIGHQLIQRGYRVLFTPRRSDVPTSRRPPLEEARAARRQPCRCALRRYRELLSDTLTRCTTPSPRSARIS